MAAKDEHPENFCELNGHAGDVPESMDDALAMMLNAIMESIFFMMPDGVVLSANKTAAMRLGLRGEKELIGKNVYDLIPKETAHLRRMHASKVLESGKPVQFEEQLSGRYLLNSVFPVLDAGGKVSRLAVFAIDITQRKQAEGLRSASEDFIKAFMDNLPVGIAVKSADTGGNPSCMKGNLPRIYLTTRESLPSPDVFWEVAYEDSEFRVEPGERMSDSRADGDPEFTYPKGGCVFRKGDDSISISSINDTAQDRSLVVSIIRDLTRRMKADDSLRRASERQKALVDHKNIKISRLDVEGRYLLIDREICRMFGKPSRDRIDNGLKSPCCCLMGHMGPMERIPSRSWRFSSN